MKTREQIDREHREARRVIYSTAKGHIIQEALGDMKIYHINYDGNNPRKRYTWREAMACFRTLARGYYAT